MRQLRAVLVRATQCGAAAVVLPLLLSAPVLAASGVDPFCKTSAGGPDLDIPMDELDLDVAEHAVSASITAHVAAGFDDRIESRFPAPPSNDTILRRIFDEAANDGNDSGAGLDRSAAAPLVELTLSPPSGDDAELRTGDESAPNTEELEERRLTPRFPGVSDAESDRYRRQMYRTDI